MQRLIKNKYKLIFWTVLAASIAVRAVLFCVHPAGLNQDEASIGYDAWAILNYGIDRAGNSFPVHLVAWGSGQNALYAYLSMPFIAVFGLNVFTVRIVNLIFSVLTVLFSYFAANSMWGKRTALIAEALVAISPWNIMLGRWGLESNIFPALFLIGFYFVLRGSKTRGFLYAAAAVFAVSLYSYGSAYLIIPIFCIAAAVVLIYKKAVPLKTVLISAVLFLVLSAPIYLFVAVNIFGLQSIKLGFITIPAMTGVSRLTTVTGGHSFLQTVKNLYNSFVLQTDGGNYNSFEFFGCIYTLSLPFWVAGIVKAFKNRSTGELILLCALGAALPLFFVYGTTNINRVNVLYIILILFTAFGINEFKQKNQILTVAAAYIVMFSGFCVKYFGNDYRQEIGERFFNSFGESIKTAVAEAESDQTIYVTKNVNMPYIYTLFYTCTPPNEFAATVKFRDVNVEFQQVESYEKFVFDSSGYSSGQAGTYVISKNEYNSEVAAEYKKFENYYVAKIEQKN